jgi:hypothetical protein
MRWDGEPSLTRRGSLSRGWGCSRACGLWARSPVAEAARRSPGPLSSTKGRRWAARLLLDFAAPDVSGTRLLRAGAASLTRCSNLTRCSKNSATPRRRPLVRRLSDAFLSWRRARR